MKKMTKQYHRTAEVARKRHLHFICGLLLFALLISMVPIQAGASDEAIPVTVSSGDTVYPVSAAMIWAICRFTYQYTRLVFRLMQEM